MTTVQEMPKVELHVHLEGSMPPETLLDLAAENHIALPFTTVGEAIAWFEFRDFPHFAEVYATISRCICTADDVERLARDFIRGQAEQNILYSEITYTALTHYKNHGIEFADQVEALTRARMWAERELDVSFGVIVDIPRDWANRAQSETVARWVAGVAGNGGGDTVVALGLGGYEVGFPPEQFASAFAIAREAGVPVVCHAGETDGPASIRGALDLLGSIRIGHGVRCLEDEELTNRLRDEKVVLEVCPSSNVCLGVFPAMEEHPLPELVQRGLSVTINSDDPALFGTTMTHELEIAASVLGMSIDAIRKTMGLAARSALCPPERRERLIRRIEAG
jgi:adenosine deaminase